MLKESHIVYIAVCEKQAKDNVLRAKAALEDIYLNQGSNSPIARYKKLGANLRVARNGLKSARAANSKPREVQTQISKGVKPSVETLGTSIMKRTSVIFGRRRNTTYG
jgi:hypothetical protein